MYIRTVTFRLDGIDPDAYAAHCEEIAPRFNEWPGLIAKVWLADDASGTFGGLYLFTSKAAADQSRATEIFQGMTQNPAFVDLEVKEHSTLEGPTRITASRLPGLVP
jgi:hypothetical protein